jgi:Asp-tRNA(Asn)/Glu-tRNA(Gln) amidotransferase A subunit family amidase
MRKGVGSLADCTASELARLVRAGEVSATAVVEAHLERIEEANPALNAIVTLRAEEARADAGRVERAISEGADLPLAGIPFTVKDIIATAGVRTTAGSRSLSDFVPTLDATAVGRLRDAGAILLGKTNCPEFGLFPYTRNPLFGETRNPLGPVTPGGSSGGEAAAIAAGCSPLGLGTDFGGSVRWPAHCTGVMALRPTAGRVPGTGQLPAPSLDEPILPNAVTLQGRVQVIGPLARSVDDLELALQVMAGPDDLDPAAVPAELRPSRRVDLATVRVAWWEGPARQPVRADVVATIREAVASLGRRGIEVSDERPAMLERAVSLYSELRNLDRVQDLRRLTRGQEEELGPDVRAVIEAAGRGPDTDPAPVWEERDRLRAEFLAFLGRYPVVVMPVATIPAYDPWGAPPSSEGFEQTMWDVLNPCRAISLFGIPAAAVPFGISSEGLPIGVQVVGRPFREDQVLAVARVLSELRAESPAGKPIGRR